MFELLNQRYRWTRGSIQTIRKVARRCWRNPQYRNSTTLAWLLTSYVYDLVVYPISLLAYGSLIATMLLGEGDLTIFVGFLFYTLFFRWIIGLPFILDHHEDPKLLAYMPLMDLYGTFVLGGAYAISVIDEVFKKRMRW